MILNFSLFILAASALLVYFYKVDRFQFTPLATNFHLFGATIYALGTILIFDQSNIIGFKGLQLEVTEATNTRIVFKVLNNF